MRLWSESNADGDEAQQSADADSAAAPADLKDVPSRWQAGRPPLGWRLCSEALVPPER